MNASLDEIADGIYRISTFVPDIGPSGFTFNQFLIDADEPMLYHTGMRGLFPVVAEAVARVVPVEALRWIAFSHVEADECGAMNRFLAAAPHARVAHGQLGCLVSLNDLADRLPLPLTDGQVLDLGGHHLRASAGTGGGTGAGGENDEPDATVPDGSPRTVRHLDTAHVPHNWESRVVFEETTRTLLCGDLMTQVGNGPAVTGDDLVDAAMAAEHIFGQTSLSPNVPAVLRRLADLEPVTLAIMHGSSYHGDGGTALRALADAYEQQFALTRSATTV